MVMRRSLGLPIALGVVMIVLLVALTIGWVLVVVAAVQKAEITWPYWTVLAVGSTFFVFLLLGVAIYLVLTIKSINLTQRQSNFIDSVTHELKSPIASMKLCLQTLGRHNIAPEQQAEFHRYMMVDLGRLDNLIDQLLDAARLDQGVADRATEDVDVAELLQKSVDTTTQHYRLPPETIKVHLEPATVRTRPVDLEVVFRNLLDNAVKYAGDAPQVGVDLFRGASGRVKIRISDNGPGIPAPLRRKIFGRFVRLGSELERSKPGTGLGLYIVRTLVRRMHGKITVRGRGSQTGTVFEVDLPAADGLA